MSTPRLTAEVTADLTPFGAAMNRLGGMADKEAAKISRQFGNRFGAGMLAGIAMTKLTEFLSSPFSRAQEISENASQLRVTAEEYQMLELAAKAAGLTVDEFIATLQTQPDGIDAAVTALEKYRQQVEFLDEDIERLVTSKYWEEYKRQLSKATVAGIKWFEKIAAWFMEPTATWDQIEKDSAVQEEVEREKSRQGSSVRLRDAITRTMREPRAPTSGGPNSATLLAQSVTSRQQIGAFVGTTPDLVVEARKTNEKLDGIRDEIRRTQEQVREALTSP